MTRSFPPSAALALGLAAGCTAGEPPPSETVIPAPAPLEARSEAATVATTVAATEAATVPSALEVALVARARDTVTVGDSLDLELRVENHSSAAITVVRPVYGSWEGARQPDYRLEWTDERGEVVPDPLGFAPGLECGVLDPIVADDRVTVAPGASEALGRAPAARPRHEVLESARPGRYSLRVRYLGVEVPGATPLHLLSAPVRVTIRGGDPALWACRAGQLADAADYTSSHVRPAGLIPAADGGSWLIVSRYLHTVRGGVADPGGDLQLRRLGPDLHPLGDATRLLASADEVGHASAVATSDGAVVIFTPGPVGGRSVQSLHVDLRGAAASAGAPKTIQRPPGNPYVTEVARSGDRIGVLHEGADEGIGPLVLSILDDQGAPIGAPIRLASMSTTFALQAIDDGWIATWAQRGEFDGGVAQRLDRAGKTIGAPLRFAHDPSHGFAGVHHHGGGFEVAFADASTRGDDPSDRMGLYRHAYDRQGRARGTKAAISPERRTDAIFGVVTWRGDAALHAFLDQGALRVGPGPGDARPLSTTAEERLLFASIGGRTILLWEDTRDDRSPACLQLRSCAPEVYGVALGPDGAPVGAPLRLTDGAVPRPLLPSPNDWQRHCKDAVRGAGRPARAGLRP